MSKVLLAALNEIGQLGNLRCAKSGLHIGGLQVVPDVRVDVLVVVTAGQFPELPVESLAAGVFFARLAPAVAAPVAERLNDQLKVWLVGQDSAAFAESDMVRRVKTNRRDIAKGSYALPLPGRAERIAAILDKPQVVLLCKGSHRIQVEYIAQRVRDHDGARFVAAGGFELGDVDLIGRQ